MNFFIEKLGIPKDEIGGKKEIKITIVRNIYIAIEYFNDENQQSWVILGWVIQGEKSEKVFFIKILEEG